MTFASCSNGFGIGCSACSLDLSRVSFVGDLDNIFLKIRTTFANDPCLDAGVTGDLRPVFLTFSIEDSSTSTIE